MRGAVNRLCSTVVELDANAASQPVALVVQARRLMDEQLTNWVFDTGPLTFLVLPSTSSGLLVRRMFFAVPRLRVSEVPFTFRSSA